MGHGMIDGDRWIAQRLAFLRDVLATDIPDDQRKVVEEEVEKLRKERGIHIGGFRLPWFPSRWIAGGTRPADPIPPEHTG